jgi:hypothetical protein
MSFYDDASLVFLPSGEAGKDGKAYSMKPTNGDGDFTFSRGSNLTATRVDSNGLIEKGRENLLLQSNQFDTTWYNNNSTETSGQSGYDGTNNAWLLTRSGGSNGGIRQNNTTSGVQTFSIYAKAGTKNWIKINNLGSVAYHQANFDLSNGVLGTITNAIDANIENVGNGWYRCSVTYNATLVNVDVRIADANNDTSGTSGSVYIQDAQLEQGLVATEYIESGATTGKAGLLEDSPRFDYSGGASCPSLLLEPSRTNLIGYSEYFEGWSNITNITPTSNYTDSPEGVNNATRLQFTANGFTYYISPQVAGVQYTLSCYAKRNDSGIQNVGFFVNGSGTVDSAWSLTNDWKRFTYTYTASNTSQRGIAGLSGADVSVYGFQIEEASYPTSYIPNHSGGSETRNGDDLNDLSVSVNNEGTFYFETKDRIFENESTNKNYLGLIESSSGNYFRFRGQSSSILIQSIGFGSNISFNPSGASLTKYLYKWDGTTIKVFVDGVERGSVSQTARFEPDTFRKAGGGSIGFSSNLKQLLIFTSALPDNQCIALTS